MSLNIGLEFLIIVVIPITIVTAGNEAFRPIIQKQQKNAKLLNLPTIIYDLGGLGMGIDRRVKNPAFHRDGRYCRLNNGWPSKGLHKPSLIADALSRLTDPNEVLLYLDGDALPVADMSGISALKFDVAVVRRPDYERLTPDCVYIKETGQVNAGVLAFRPTPAAQDFIKVWVTAMNRLGGDQLALNEILPRKLQVGEIRPMGSATLAVLSSVYNVTYPPAAAGNEIGQAKVIHFKSQSWRKHVQGPDVDALMIPDHRRAALLQHCPQLTDLINIQNSKTALVITEDDFGVKVMPSDMAVARQLCQTDWTWRKIFLDDKCDPTFWLGRSKALA